MEKKYINGLILKSKTVETKNGPMGILKVSVRVDEFIKELQEMAHDGWVNIDILKRREPSEKGVTHYAVENTWAKDKALKEGSPSQFAQGSSIGDIPTDDIPF